MYICVITWLCFVFTGPSALTVNIIINIESLSIVIQWDAVDDFLPTTYTVVWTDGRDLFDVATVEEQTSYTITGLTLDAVYTIAVSAANKCGQSPEFRTSVSLPTGIYVIVIPWAQVVCLIYTPEARGLYTSGKPQVPMAMYHLMCNHVWANQHNGSSMDSLYLYRDLLDCIVGLNLMIKTFHDVILKPTIKSCRTHYIKD